MRNRDAGGWWGAFWYVIAAYGLVFAGLLIRSWDLVGPVPIPGFLPAIAACFVSGFLIVLRVGQLEALAQGRDIGKCLFDLVYQAAVGALLGSFFAMVGGATSALGLRWLWNLVM